MVAWLKKMKLVAKLQQGDDVVSLLPLYLEGVTLALYMEMEEDDQKQIEQIKAHETDFRHGVPCHRLNWTSTGTKHRSLDPGGI